MGPERRLTFSLAGDAVSLGDQTSPYLITATIGGIIE
jgi:hypothetical protein